MIDGGKRLAVAAVITFCGLNGRRRTLANDEACDLVMNVAAGELDQVDEISAILQGGTVPAGDDARISARKPRGCLDSCMSGKPADRGAQSAYGCRDWPTWR